MGSRWPDHDRSDRLVVPVTASWPGVAPTLDDMTLAVWALVLSTAFLILGRIADGPAVPVEDET